MLRVVVVDDESLIRSGLQMILSSAGDIDVVAACEGSVAVETVARTRPDVVLLDVRMPGTDGLAVLARLRAQPEPPVVAMLTAFATDEYLYTALSEGAAGYLLKDTDPEQLVRDVRTLAAGGRLLSPAVAPAVIEGYLGHSARAASASVDALTAREVQVLSLLGTGLTNAQIATRLGLATSTAKDHISTVINKLGLDNRVQAAVFAERAGLIPPAADPDRSPAPERHHQAGTR
ncbi:response regulator [Streptomyces sp. cg36]|uniref:response regulator n=1 Tax=Streptomyces sp. cg36 TaxID=3238798 RepID=UPI0034E1A002